MKALKVILNVFGIFFAVIFSIALTLVLLAAPIVSSASSFLQTETMHNVMKEIDYQEIIMSNADVSATLAEQGLDAETVEAIVASEAVAEVMDLYLEDIFAAIEEKTGEKNLTSEAIKTIAYEHMDEIVEIAKDYKDPAETVTDAEIRSQISQVVEEYAEEVVELFPAATDLGLVENDTMTEDEVIATEVVKNLKSGSAVLFMVLVAVVLSVFIVLCRIKRLKGFLWLGVVFSQAAFFAFVAAGVMGSSGLTQLIPAEGFIVNLIDSVFSVLSGQLLVKGILLLAIGLLSTAIFVVGRILWGRTKTKTDALPE